MSDVLKLQQRIEELERRNAQLGEENARLRGDDRTENGQPNTKPTAAVGFIGRERMAAPTNRTIDPPESPHVSYAGMVERGVRAEEQAIEANAEARKRVLPATAKDGDPEGVVVGPDAVDESNGGRPGLAAATATREGRESSQENAEAPTPDTPARDEARQAEDEKAQETRTREEQASGADKRRAKAKEADA